MRKFSLTALLLVCACCAVVSGQTQTDPLTQIAWPRMTGQGAPISYCPTIITGTITLGSALITSPSSTTGLYRYQLAVGTGVPTGSTVSAVNSFLESTVARSAAATTSSTESISFYSLGMPYTDVLNEVQYVCGSSGWIKVGNGGGGSGSVAVNGVVVSTGVSSTFTMNGEPI